MKQLILFLLVLLPFLPSAAQQRDYIPFNGLIHNAEGKPLSGIKVIRQSTGESMKSDKKGRFGFRDITPEDTLMLVTKEKDTYTIPVDGKKSMKIVVLPSGINASEDRELQDIGYGYIKRRDKTQASSGISGEELRRSGYNNLLQALQGRIPGLSVQTNHTGQTTEVNIRGQRSFYGSNTPLFVVDGIIVESISHISVYDVEYVEVLKEASIYGSRGANGAILIKTKR